MAESKGTFQFRGTLSNLVFYKLNGKDVVRRSKGTSRATYLKSPKYAYLRNHASEFSNASKAGKLFRQACGDIYRYGSDKYTYQRVTQLMKEVLKLDPSFETGKRTVAKGMQHPDAMKLFKAFPFRKPLHLSSIMHEQPVWNASKGELSFKGLLSGKDFKMSKGTTHIVLSFAQVKIDFKNENYTVRECDDFILPAKTRGVKVFMQTKPFSASNKGHLFGIFSVNFCQEVNGEYYSLQGGVMGVLG